MLKYTIEGYFFPEQAKKIKETLQGKTYFDFQVSHGGVAGNHTITVISHTEGYTNEDLKNMVIHYIMNSI